MAGTFRSLKHRDYRLWAAGAFLSNIGTWMQRIAQDWLVLSILSHGNASAVGRVTALQFAPQILLLPWTGQAADRLDRRRLLLLTQGCLGLLALGLGLLTLSGHAQLWHVDVFALLLGCVTAFDSPARLAFVSDLVAEKDLPNAVALNSSSFNAARMIGPAVAGLVIAQAGCGWAFLINAVSFIAVLAALMALRTHAPKHEQGPRADEGMAHTLRYLRERSDLSTTLLMLLLIASFGLNFPLLISSMAVKVFHVGAGQFGLLSSMMAIGSVSGALLTAQRPLPHLGVLKFSAAGFAAACALSACMPSYLLFGISLAFVGLCAQSFNTSANGLLQVGTRPSLRGRVLALFLAIALGGTALGAPILGWVADTWGPRGALWLAAISGFAALCVGLRTPTPKIREAGPSPEPLGPDLL